MIDSFQLMSDALPGVSLRTAAATDSENLRTWKNANREFFFHKDVIHPEQQQAWFRGYLQRPEDWMFMVHFQSPQERWEKPLGCMGFRRDQGGEADVYNVILGRPEFKGRGVMAAAFRLMCSFARQRLGAPVVARVLTSNPAIGWYLKQGFEVVAQEDRHYFIRLSETRFLPVAPISQLSLERKETKA